MCDVCGYVQGSKRTKSHVAIGRKPLPGGGSELFIMISNAQHRQGLKYQLLNNNIQAVFTKLVHEGRTTVRQAGEIGSQLRTEFIFKCPNQCVGSGSRLDPDSGVF